MHCPSRGSFPDMDDHGILGMVEIISRIVLVRLACDLELDELDVYCINDVMCHVAVEAVVTDLKLQLVIRISPQDCVICKQT